MVAKLLAGGDLLMTSPTDVHIHSNIIAVLYDVWSLDENLSSPIKLKTMTKLENSNG